MIFFIKHRDFPDFFYLVGLVSFNESKIQDLIKHVLNERNIRS